MALAKKIVRKLSRDNGKRYEMNAPEPCFVLRYLGMRTISSDFGKDSDFSGGIQLCGECVAELEADRVVKKVSLLISTNIGRGLTITDWLSKREQATFKLHNIAFCTTDQRKPTMFSFIGKCDGFMQCHVFDCEKEEKANEVCEALSRAFLTAHDNWQRSQKRRDERRSRDLTMTRNSPNSVSGLQAWTCHHVKDIVTEMMTSRLIQVMSIKHIRTASQLMKQKQTISLWARRR